MEKKQRSTTIFQKTNKRKEINTKNTPKQILNVMLIEDRKINLICHQNKSRKTDSICNAYQLTS